MVDFPDTPSQRVQFILGTEEDEEHVPHELFTELGLVTETFKGSLLRELSLCYSASLENVRLGHLGLDLAHKPELFFQVNHRVIWILLHWKSQNF